MDLPEGLLDKLCCDFCKNYLSCGPIFLNYKTNKVCCGRCTNKKQSATNVRYSHYETIASVLLFPCKFGKYGCPHKLQFSPENTHQHEQTCEYKKRPCPMSSSKTEPDLKCQWLGRSANLLHHCKILHPDKILSNPCTFQHEITKPMHETYLITAFNLLFILNVYISREIIVNVRLIGDATTAQFFKFILKMCTKIPNTNKLVKDGVIYAENANSPNSLVLSIGNLINIFDGVSRVNFKLMIEQQPDAKKMCRFCTKETKQDRACVDCKQNTISCCFTKNGCSFSDVSSGKCKKHELYFCRYLIECPDCNLNVERNSLFKHYISNHGAFRAKNGKRFRVKEGYKQFCILIVDDEIFLCKFSLACYRLLFSVFSPFSTDELKSYGCQIRINDPGNCYNHKLTPKIDFKSCYDWNININMYNYPMWRQYGLNLCVFIKKKDEL